MNKKIEYTKEFFQKCGSIGGKKSKRVLTKEQAIDLAKKRWNKTKGAK